MTVGVFGLAQASAQMVGPGIGLAISAILGYPGLFLAAAGTAVASLVCAAAVPKDLRTDPRMSQAHLSRRQSTWSAAAIPSVAQFAVSVAYGTIVSFVAVVARDRALTAVGAFFALFALTGIDGRLVAGRVNDIWGVAAALTSTFFSLAIGMGLLAAARDHTLLVLAALLTGLGIGGAHAVRVTRVANQAASAYGPVAWLASLLAGSLA